MREILGNKDNIQIKRMPITSILCASHLEAPSRSRCSSHSLTCTKLGAPLSTCRIILTAQAHLADLLQAAPSRTSSQSCSLNYRKRSIEAILADLTVHSPALRLPFRCFAVSSLYSRHPLSTTLQRSLRDKLQ